MKCQNTRFDASVDSSSYRYKTNNKSYRNKEAWVSIMLDFLSLKCYDQEYI